MFAVHRQVRIPHAVLHQAALTAQVRHQIRVRLQHCLAGQAARLPLCLGGTCGMDTACEQVLLTVCNLGVSIVYTRYGVLVVLPMCSAEISYLPCAIVQPAPALLLRLAAVDARRNAQQ